MKTIERAHIYELENKHEGVQRLVFFKDLPADSAWHDGVLCQEVLRALIDRMLDLWAQRPCHESTEIIQKLRECLVLFETRAARGTLEKSYAKVGQHVEQLPVKANGHVFDIVPGDKTI
jgi:hypothetical protein